jgi:gas vesicle protein
MIGAQRALSTVRDFDLNDALHLIGLSRRPTAMEQSLPVIGFVAIGAAIGAGTALLLAPCSGSELRGRISDRFSDAKSRVQDATHRLEERVEGMIHPEGTGAQNHSYSMNS